MLLPQLCQLPCRLLEAACGDVSSAPRASGDCCCWAPALTVCIQTHAQLCHAHCSSWADLLHQFVLLIVEAACGLCLELLEAGQTLVLVGLCMSSLLSCPSVPVSLGQGVGSQCVPVRPCQGPAARMQGTGTPEASKEQRCRHMQPRVEAPKA